MAAMRAEFAADGFVAYFYEYNSREFGATVVYAEDPDPDEDEELDYFVWPKPDGQTLHDFALTHGPALIERAKQLRPTANS